LFSIIFFISLSTKIKHKTYPLDYLAAANAASASAASFAACSAASLASSAALAAAAALASAFF
jgi:hypothetical protein